MRVNAERKDRGKKLMQVLLIRTAEKTERKKNQRKRITDRKKEQPLAEKIFWFCIFQIIILWSERVSVCVCVYM